jgi:hypothetical protein
VDAPLAPEFPAAKAIPRMVETIYLGEGRSQVRIDFEDAEPDPDWWYPWQITMSPETYIDQGVEIYGAGFKYVPQEDAGQLLVFSRSGLRWLEGIPHPSWDGWVNQKTLPISMRFPRKRADVVRIHVGRKYAYLPWFHHPRFPPVETYRLTCFSGEDEVGSQSVRPPTPYDNYTVDGPPEYVPLEVRARGITHCEVETGPAFTMDDIEITFEKEADELKLTCTSDRGRDVVTRGKLITCTAEKDPADEPGPLVITGWAFENVQRGDGDPTSTEWKGIMVKGGTVQVSGRVGSGEVRTATATIEVVDREWPDLPKLELRVFGASDGETDVPALPARIAWASDLGTFTPLLSPAPGQQWEDAIQNIVGGPNDGLDYFADLSFPLRGRIRINNEALSAGSGFYDAQERNSTGGGTTIGGPPWCSARVVTRTLPGLVRAHEERHEVVYREKFGEVVRAELPSLERMTGSYSDLADAYDALRGRANSIATSASLDIHKLRGNPNRITVSENGRDCNLKNEDGRLLETEPTEP